MVTFSSIINIYHEQKIQRRFSSTSFDRFPPYLFSSIKPFLSRCRQGCLESVANQLSSGGHGNKVLEKLSVMSSSKKSKNINMSLERSGSHCLTTLSTSEVFWKTALERLASSAQHEGVDERCHLFPKWAEFQVTFFHFA